MTMLAGCALFFGCGPSLQEAATRHDDETQRADRGSDVEQDGVDHRENARPETYREWYENGQLKVEGTYVDGKRDGKWSFYYENGELKREGRYLEGQKTGQWIELDESGRTTVIGSYRSGRRSGEWSFFSETAQPMKRGHFKKGRRVGMWTFYCANGEKCASGRYKDGHRVDVWTFWTTEGERQARFIYGRDGVEREFLEEPDEDGDSPSASEPDRQLTGMLSKGGIREAIKNNRSQVRTCYEERLNSDHTLDGRLKVRFVVGPSGLVVAVSVETSTLDDPLMEACVVDEVLSWQFAEPKGGGDVAVIYPFNFSRK